MRRVRWRALLLMSPEMHRLYRQEGKRLRAVESSSKHLAVEAEPRLSSSNHEKAGEALVEVLAGGYSYFVPRFVQVRELAPIFREVFDPAHVHFYEYGQCKIHAGDVVVDAGASEGFFTRFALERGARVIVVEPSRVWVSALERTFAAEISTGQVLIERACLEDQQGEAEFNIDPQIGWVLNNQPGSCEVVPLQTIDALVEKLGYEKCDFIKMDIEGAERRAVAGARETLRRFRPRLAVAVYHEPAGYLDIRSDLHRLRAGYHVTSKGLQSRYRYKVPVVLHAWPV